MFVHSLENNHQTRCTLPRPWSRFLSCTPGPSSAPSCSAPRGPQRPGVPARIAPFLYTTARYHSLPLTHSFCTFQANFSIPIKKNKLSFYNFNVCENYRHFTELTRLFVWMLCFVCVKLESTKRVCVGNRGLTLAALPTTPAKPVRAPHLRSH